MPSGVVMLRGRPSCVYVGMNVSRKKGDAGTGSPRPCSVLVRLYAAGRRRADAAAGCPAGAANSDCVWVGERDAALAFSLGRSTNEAQAADPFPLPSYESAMPNNNPRRRNGPGEANGAGLRPSVRQEPRGRPIAAPGAGPRVSRNLKIFLVLALFLLVTAGVVAVYFWLRPPDPFRLVLVGAAYEQDLPPRPTPSAGAGSTAWTSGPRTMATSSSAPEKGKNLDVRRQTIEELQRRRRRGGRQHQRRRPSSSS